MSGRRKTKKSWRFLLVPVLFSVIVLIILLSILMSQRLKPEPYRRLSRNVLPLLYNISIKPDFERLMFEGTSDVEINIVKDSLSRIELHAASELTVKKVLLVHSSTGRNVDVRFRYNDERTDRTLIVLASKSLRKGAYRISFEFAGNVSSGMDGIYRSEFSTPNGKETIITTQFQAVAARKAFPCWDEPSFKAQFIIELFVPNGMTAFSNMPIRATRLWRDKGIRMIFEKSPPMSTYLLAFSIGKFESNSAKDNTNIVHTIHTRPGKYDMGQFALNVSIRALPYFNDYFNITYPLPKLDLIAIPDFSYGAMENWGCSIFREQYLLIDHSTASTYDLQKISIIVGHELAHQWFGNLVTLEWWTDIWLNEGFATWIEYLCTDHLFPEFDIWTQFVGQCMRRAMIADRLETTHAIEVLSEGLKAGFPK